MPRFPVKKEQISGNYSLISGSDFKHITKVLRLKEGDEIELFDENSTEYRCEIIKVNERDLKAEIKESWVSDKEPALNIDLYQSVIKGSKMDLVIQKTTELGVNRIIPVTTERTQNWIKVKVERLNKISVEAAKQCGRTNPPEISETISFLNALESCEETSFKLLLYENSDRSLKQTVRTFKNNQKNVAVFIGPEGGYTEDEVRIAESYEIRVAGLGKRILRAETASIASISILQYELGDLG